MPKYRVSTSHGDVVIETDGEASPEQLSQAAESHFTGAGTPHAGADTGTGVKTPVMQPDSPESGSGGSTHERIVARLRSEDAARRAEKPAWMKGTVWANDDFVNERIRSEQAGMGNVPRVTGAVLGSEGGPTGAAINALGERIGQFVGGEEGDSGKVTQAGIIGAIPLGPAAGLMAKLKNAGKMAGGGYVGEQARSIIDEGQLSDNATQSGATLGGLTLGVSALGKILAMVAGRSSPEQLAEMLKKRLNNADTADSIERMAAKGAVVNPASQNPGLINNTLGSVAGLQNIANRAKAINAPVINEVGRAEASLAPTERINEDTLQVARSRISSPLNQLRGMGLGAEVDAWQAANQTRQDLLEQRTAGTITPAQFRIQLAGAQAAMRSTEQTIDKAATAAGRHELVGALPQIQTNLAKNYDVRRAVPTGTGHVDADAVSGMAAQRVDNPEMLTGGLRDIANFNNAAYNAAGNVNQIAPHSGTLGPHAALGAAALGSGPKAATSAGIMGLRGPIAKLLLSPEYQAGRGILGRLSGGAKPSYSPGTTSNPEIERIMARILAALKQAPAAPATAQP